MRFEIPDGLNLVLGHSHFVMTAKDLYEAVPNAAPAAKFAAAFNEASGQCRVPIESNDEDPRHRREFVRKIGYKLG